MHFSGSPKFYNGPIPLNEVWPRLLPKHFGKLFDIYQLDIARLHLWKTGIFSSWGELRSHYPVFQGIWLPFPPKNFGKFHNFLISFVVEIISWKCESCSWWVVIYPEMGPICLVPGANSTKFGRADRMDFSPLTNSNISGGSNLEKWREITREELSVYKGLCVLLFHVFKHLLLRKTDVLKTCQKSKFLGKKLWRNALASKSKKV